jgi:predicted nuclease with TOPRIM domain
LSLKTNQFLAFFSALKDHETKIDYYKNLIKQERERKDNEIHHGGDQEYEDLTKKIKFTNKKLEEAFEILQGQVTELKANPFKNPKVRQLWIKVGFEKSNLTV